MFSENSKGRPTHFFSSYEFIRHLSTYYLFIIYISARKSRVHVQLVTWTNQSQPYIYIYIYNIDMYNLLYFMIFYTITFVIRWLRNALRLLCVCYLSAAYVFLTFVTTCLTFAIRLYSYVCYTFVNLLLSRPLAITNAKKQT